MILSKKAQNISPSITLAITANAKRMKKEGIDVISFGAGEPDFDTPSNIKAAAIEAINKGYTKYTASSGIIELKEAVIKKLHRDNNLNYNTNQIIISCGAKQALSDTFMSILNPGDEVIVPVPYWVTYPELIKLSGGVPVYAKCSKDNSFKYDFSKVEKIVSEKTKAIIINSPNNPSGSVYTKEELEKLAEFAKKHDLIIISDEIYEKLIYGNTKHISIAALSDDAYKRTIVINGVSKSYSMTGWRIGYAAASEDIIKLMSSIQSHTTSNPSSISQYAALEALNGDQSTVPMMRNEFSKRRDYMVKKINSINHISCSKPEGAFYVLIDISKLFNKKISDNIIKGSVDFSKYLLDEEKVAVIPGAGFGIDNYVRLSYATSMENIVEGLNRIEHFINKIA